MQKGAIGLNGWAVQPNISNASIILLLQHGREYPHKKCTPRSATRIASWSLGALSGRYASVKVKSLGSLQGEADEIQLNELQRSG